MLIANWEHEGMMGMRNRDVTLAQHLHCEFAYKPVFVTHPLIVDGGYPVNIHPDAQLVLSPGPTESDVVVGVFPTCPNYFGPLTSFNPEKIHHKDFGIIGYSTTTWGHLRPAKERYKEVKKYLPSCLHIKCERLTLVMPYLSLLIGNSGFTSVEARAMGLPFIALHRGVDVERGRAEMVGVPYCESPSDLPFLVEIMQGRWAPPQKWGIPGAVNYLRNNL